MNGPFNFIALWIAQHDLFCQTCTCNSNWNSSSSPKVHLIFIREQNTTASTYIFVIIYYRVLKPFGFEISQSKVMESNNEQVVGTWSKWCSHWSHRMGGKCCMATSHRSAKSDAARIAHLWRQKIFEKNLSCLCCLLFVHCFGCGKGRLQKCCMMIDINALCKSQIINSTSEPIYIYIYVYLKYSGIAGLSMVDYVVCLEGASLPAVTLRF